ncbi:unnamed protein product [Closterium sp. NIES-64]|nr:unnamed protein product [Closterium sp. NIES-64]
MNVVAPPVHSTSLSPLSPPPPSLPFPPTSLSPLSPHLPLSPFPPPPSLPFPPTSLSPLSPQLPLSPFPPPPSLPFHLTSLSPLSPHLPLSPSTSRPSLPLLHLGLLMNTPRPFHKAHAHYNQWPDYDLSLPSFSPFRSPFPHRSPFCSPFPFRSSFPFWSPFPPRISFTCRSSHPPHCLFPPLPPLHDLPGAYHPQATHAHMRMRSLIFPHPLPPSLPPLYDLPGAYLPHLQATHAHMRMRSLTFPHPLPPPLPPLPDLPGAYLLPHSQGTLSACFNTLSPLDFFRPPPPSRILYLRHSHGTQAHMKKPLKAAHLVLEKYEVAMQLEVRIKEGPKADLEPYLAAIAQLEESVRCCEALEAVKGAWQLALSHSQALLKDAHHRLNAAFKQQLQQFT